MDNSNPTNPAPAAAAVSPAPALNPQPNMMSNNKMILWLILGLVIVVLLIGGAYFYVNSQKANAPAESQTPQTQTVDSLENDLNSADAGDLENDFAPVDSDLQSL